ncbi:MAG TPA: nucleoside diphosphate kinase regulator [Sphingopyxis sp.]|nr:nucleoside diphosphate kinase regulator [Sphingopyxis sp.]
MTTRSTSRRPRIHMIDTQADALTTLALSREDDLPDVCEMLLDEIGRATVYTAKKFPADVVAMGSEVTFVDETNGTERTVSLVYPRDADISAGRISILTPIGAGLIGLQQGQAINWPDRDGKKRSLSIVRVAQNHSE